MTLRSRIGGIVGLAIVVASACGVPTDGSPRAVSDNDLPASVRAGAATTTTTAESAAQQEVVDVYFIRGTRIVRERDMVPAPADLDAVLGLLQRGPSEKQTEARDRSALTGIDLIRAATVSGSTASIELDPSFADTPPTDQIFALAQIVLTATGRPGVTTVRLRVDGETISIPRADGSLTTDPLTRADYASLLAR